MLLEWVYRVQYTCIWLEHFGILSLWEIHMKYEKQSCKNDSLNIEAMFILCLTIFSILHTLTYFPNNPLVGLLLSFLF